VLDDRIIVNVQGPAADPIWEVVGQTNPMNIFKLGGHLSEPRFKTSIVVAEGPELLRLECYPPYFAKTFLANLKLLLHAREPIPADGGMAGDTGGVENVPVHDDD
jgi:hypothetical protein